MLSMILWDLFVIGIFVIWGGICYVIDDRMGTAIYAFGYKLTHKEGLPEGTKYGFIAGRSTEARIWWSIILGIFAFYWLHGAFAVTIPGNLLVLLVSIIGVFVGFIAGPFFVRLWGKKKQAIEKIEKIERGEVDVVAEVGKAASGLAQSATETVTGLGHRVGDVISDALGEAAKHLPGSENPPVAEISPEMPTEAEPEKPVEASAIPEVEIAEATPELSDFEKAKAGIDKFNQG